MATNLTVDLLDTVLRELYPNGDALTEIAYQIKQRPFLSMLKKGQFDGDSQRVPTIIEDSQGLGATFATAQTNTYPANITTFTVTPVNSYNVARVTGNAIRQSRNKRGALVAAVEVAMKSGVNGLSNDIETKLYRTRGGALGTVNTTVTGTTLTLTTARDVNNFAVNMELVFAADEASAIRTGTATSITVTAINRTAGTMTVDTLSNVASLADGDSIFREGDYVSAADALNICGLASWCPASAPSATAFWGVTRTTDSRLGGCRYTGTSVSVEEAIVNGASLCAEIGSGGSVINTCLISHTDFRTLIAEMGSKVQREATEKTAAGYSAITVHGPTGPIDVIPAAKCPAGHTYVFDDSKFELLACGDVVAILDEDGNTWRALSTSDAYEVRLGFLGNLICYDTSAICHITV